MTQLKCFSEFAKRAGRTKIHQILMQDQVEAERTWKQSDSMHTLRAPDPHSPVIGRTRKVVAFWTAGHIPDR